MAIYGDRIAGLPELLQALYYHPRGMTFAALADEVGRSERDVRETLRAYHLTDLARYLPDLVARPEVVEFFGGDADADGDPLRAPKVRLVAADPGQELGIAYTSLTDLARCYRIASYAIDLDPGNEVLASATAKLQHALLPGVFVEPAESWEHLGELQAAITEHRRVRLTYARFWSPQIEEMIIEPYRVIRTRRGWELDAAPGDERSELRTYLLSNVRALATLPETFTVPADLATMITRHRTETAVVLEIPHDARWAVDTYAERVELLSDGVETARLRVFVLQPVRLRVGLMIVVGGPTARVIAPDDLVAAGAEVAVEMLRLYEPVAGPGADGL